MRRVVERVRRTAVVLLIALVFVPVAFHGHGHGRSGASSGACGICLATHHSPAAQALPVVAPVDVGASIRLVVASVVAPANVGRHPHAGRGPPASAATAIA